MLDGNKSFVSTLYKPKAPKGCIFLLQLTDWLENAALFKEPRVATEAASRMVTTHTDKYVYVHVPCVCEDDELVHRPSLPPLRSPSGQNCCSILAEAAILPTIKCERRGHSQLANLLPGYLFCM